MLFGGTILPSSFSQGDVWCALIRGEAPWSKRKRGDGSDTIDDGPPEVVALQPLAVIDHSCKGRVTI